MPSCESMVFIGESRGFRPCAIGYNPPAFGGDKLYEILYLKDAKKEKRYNLKAAAKNNDLQWLINMAIAKKMEPETPPEPPKKRGRGKTLL